MFAVVDIAGKQEKVTEGMVLNVPSLSEEEGAKVVFDNVLLLSKNDDTTIGSPYVSGSSVEAKVIGNGKDDKVEVFKMKHRKRYRIKQGHRQGHTKIEITKIK
ncbi:50S ribosomal protein L21 [Candidatus Peribacteria bacterium]|nr:50S ribosomal protein L21 [Candidatus Peribacteria bacterium]MBT4021350.1 50S ribosomal protein L21 [Candidatus Peribacteria bacterium]MBT4240757.1 50S ribosomal protein L21 [Candidatus Peribacteria bacterium]MBT4474214.1 50S ribosomal protein L21 [Candidatus Peribacteria bacterium]